MATVEEMQRGQRVQLGDRKGIVYYVEPPFMKSPGFAHISWDDGIVSRINAAEYGQVTFPFEPDWTLEDITT